MHKIQQLSTRAWNHVRAASSGSENAFASHNSTKTNDIYTPLMPDQFRLVEIAPGPFDQPLRGEFKIASFEKPPPYHAISYTWGDPTPVDTVSFGRGTIGISASLSSALRRFRSDTEPTMLWADALCIYQHSDDEKLQQIGSMDRIYQNAEKVLVWLGSSDKDDALALRTILVLSQIWRENQTENGYDDDAGNSYINEHAESLMIKDGHQAECLICSDQESPRCCGLSLRGHLDTVIAFWNKPWFSRLWVVQEAALAQVCEMHCGLYFISLQSAQEAVDALQKFVQSSRCTLIFPRTDRISIDRAWLMLKTIREGIMYRVLGSGPDFLSLIMDTSQLLTSNPKDRMYGLFGLAPLKAAETLWTGFDNTIPLSRLWWITSAFILLSSIEDNSNRKEMPIDYKCRSLVFALAGIQQCEGLTSRHDSPCSWVPDYGALTSECVRKHAFYCAALDESAAGGRSDFTLNEELHVDGNILSISGRVVDRIYGICVGSEYSPSVYHNHKAPSEDHFWYELITNLLPWYAKCFKFVVGCTNLSPKSEEMALLLGRGLSTAGYPSGYRGAFKRRFDEAVEMNRFIDWNATPQRVYKSLHLFLRRDLWHYHLDSTQVLAVTEQGRMGWVPKTARMGDLVCLFQGAARPFLIRDRTDGLFHVLGDSYIEGIMKGEAWSTDKRETRIFRLR